MPGTLATRPVEGQHGVQEFETKLAASTASLILLFPGRDQVRCKCSFQEDHSPGEPPPVVRPRAPCRCAAHPWILVFLEAAPATDVITTLNVYVIGLKSDNRIPGKECTHFLDQNHQIHKLTLSMRPNCPRRPKPAKIWRITSTCQKPSHSVMMVPHIQQNSM